MVHPLTHSPGPQKGSRALDSYFSGSLVSWDPGQRVSRTKMQNLRLGPGKPPDTLGQQEVQTRIRRLCLESPLLVTCSLRHVSLSPAALASGERWLRRN